MNKQTKSPVEERLLDVWVIIKNKCYMTPITLEILSSEFAKLQRDAERLRESRDKLRDRLEVKK